MKAVADLESEIGEVIDGKQILPFHQTSNWQPQNKFFGSLCFVFTRIGLIIHALNY